MGIGDAIGAAVGNATGQAGQALTNPSGVWPAGTPVKWGRTDQGIDGTVPPGTPALAIGAGVIHLLHDPSGFGSAYAVLALDRPIAVGGQSFSAVYYGHLYPTVADGAHVTPGQTIATAGQHGGGNASFEVGGFELGFFDMARGPVPNTGEIAAQFFKGLLPGDASAAAAGGGGVDCTGGCKFGSHTFGGVKIHTQDIADAIAGKTLAPDVPDICVITGCEEKAFVAGLITLGGALVSLLGAILIVKWGMKNTDAGRAVTRSVTTVAGLVIPETRALTAAGLAGGGSRKSGDVTKGRDVTRTAGQLPGEQPGAYEEWQRSGRQPDQGDETPEAYVERMDPTA